MVRRLVIGSLLAASAFLGACKNAPSEEQCKQLLDHLVELEFKKAGSTQTDAVKAEMTKQKKAVSDARTAEFMTQCTEKISRARVECAISAGDIDKGVAACDGK